MDRSAARRVAGPVRRGHDRERAGDRRGRRQTYEAEGECRLSGANRSFYADDVTITLQIDETHDPTVVYADVTTPEGIVFLTEFDADLSYESADSQLSASGDMVENYNEGQTSTVSFSITATCDV